MPARTGDWRYGLVYSPPLTRSVDVGCMRFEACAGAADRSHELSTCTRGWYVRLGLLAAVVPPLWTSNARDFRSEPHVVRLFRTDFFKTSAQCIVLVST